MNAKNNFTVTGFICKDAEVKNFEKASIARFGIILKHTEKKGAEETSVSAILSLETWMKKDDAALSDLLKKGKEVTVEGFFKPETYMKDGKSIAVIKNIATKISAYVREDKKGGTPKTKRKASK